MMRSPNPISALIICCNERDNIGNSLESVDFCAEIIVVDSGSTDGTLELIETYRLKGLPIRLLHNDWPGFPRQRQFAEAAATQPWCLSIEADEKVDSQLRDSIQAIVTKDDHSISGWHIRRCDWLAGYGYAHKWVLHNRILRLFRRGEGSMDADAGIHASYKVSGRTAVIKKGLLLHFRNLTLEDDVARANNYSTGKAAMLVAEGRRPSLLKLVFSPPATWLKFYLAKRYFLCGRPGFIYSMMMMVYSFLTEAKLFRASLKPDRSRQAL